MTRHPAPRYRAPARRRASRRRGSRPANLHVLMLALVALAALGWGAWASGVAAADLESPAPGSTEVAPRSQDETAAPASHVTFGSHTRANQPCASCHTGRPDSEIACRSCHGNVCGKDAKTVSDCLKCHKTGITDDWTSGTQ